MKLFQSYYQLHHFWYSRSQMQATGSIIHIYVGRNITDHFSCMLCLLELDFIEPRGYLRLDRYSGSILIQNNWCCVFARRLPLDVYFYQFLIWNGRSLEFSLKMALSCNLSLRMAEYEPNFDGWRKLQEKRCLTLQRVSYCFRVNLFQMEIASEFIFTIPHCYLWTWWHDNSNSVDAFSFRINGAVYLQGDWPLDVYFYQFLIWNGRNLEFSSKKDLSCNLGLRMEEYMSQILMVEGSLSRNIILLQS